MKFIQDEKKEAFINVDSILSVKKMDGNWAVLTNQGRYYITDYTLIKLLEWPSSFIYWSDEKSGEEFLR